MSAQIGRPSLGDPGNSRGQSGDPEDVRCPPFECVRKLGRLGRTGGVSAGAALTPGSDPAVGARTDVTRPGPGRAEKRLVTGECQDVDRRRSQIDRDNARRLGRVDQEQGPGFANDRRDRLDWLDGPEDVRGMRHRDEARARLDRSTDRFGVHIPGLGSDSRQRDDTGLLQGAQRPADRIMLQVRRHDMVAGRTIPLIARFSPSVQFRVKIQRSAASPRKN